jgi:PEP-CTERM motif
MKRTTKMVIRSLIVCALVCAATSYSHAGTIIKLNLGGVGPDIGMNAGGVLSTVNDGAAPTVGDQNTDIEYTGAFDFIPDVNTTTASFTLQGLQEVGPASVFGSLVIQNFQGGQFSLFDPANVLLLQGPLTNSALTGVLGPPGTGALFTTTLGAVTGGTLLPLIAPGTVSLSMNMTNVNGGLGFAVIGGGPALNQFLADASISISADFVPEPTAMMLLGLGSAAMIFVRGRRK